MTQKTDHAQPLFTPDQRLRAVPVECTRHTDDFGWDGIRVEDYANLPACDFTVPAMDHHLLVYHYEVLEGEYRHACAGRRTVTRLRAGQLSFVPAGADNHWSFGEGAPSALHLLVGADVYDAALHTSPGDLRDDFRITCARLERIARRLKAELAHGGTTGPLFAQTMGQLLCERIADLFGRNLREAPALRADVRAARDLLASEYHRPVGLAELAGVCGLSKSQLLRAFRHAFGTTPHQYQIDRRVASAKHRLLAREDVSLAQIALDLGFADQSHFTRQFFQATGMTPGRYRNPI